VNIGIIGGSGMAGSRIAKEAADRGHDVTAIVRNRSRVADGRLKVLERDVFRLTAEDLAPFDVVVEAFKAPPGQERQHVEVCRHLIAILRNAPGTRLIVVGGAGSLYVDEALTTRLVDTPDFPAAYLGTARNMAEYLDILRGTEGVSWTFVSPSAIFSRARGRGSMRSAVTGCFSIPKVKAT